MKVLHNIDDYRPQGRRTSLTIGNFDGCHLGHQRLLKKALDTANKTNSSSLVLSFTPNPKFFFERIEAVQNLFTDQQKEVFCQQLGFEHLILQKFTTTFSQLTPEEFFQKIMLLNPAAITVGPNFRFGKNRLGDNLFLRTRCEDAGILLTTPSAVLHSEVPISSTRIREHLIKTGNVNEVAEMLGRRYSVVGRIVRGDQLGRQIGTPTVNLGEYNQLLPKNGVYSGLVVLENEQTHSAVINIGFRPTVTNSASKLQVEAHLINKRFSEELYGHNVIFYFHQRIRDEQKFSSRDALRDQISRDIVEANHHFSELK